MCNEAVWGIMGLESRRDRAKLNWWYKVCSILDDRYSDLPPRAKTEVDLGMSYHHNIVCFRTSHMAIYNELFTHKL